MPWPCTAALAVACAPAAEDIAVGAVAKRAVASGEHDRRCRHRIHSQLGENVAWRLVHAGDHRIGVHVHQPVTGAPREHLLCGCHLLPLRVHTAGVCHPIKEEREADPMGHRPIRVVLEAAA